LNFSYTEEGLTSDGTTVEVEKSYVPVTETAMFALEDVEAFEAKRYAVEDNSGKNDNNNSENTLESGAVEFAKKDDEEETKKDDKGAEEKCPECGKPKDECTCKEDEDDDDKKKKYSLEEIPEYVELLDKYSSLENDYNALKETHASVEEELNTLREFKASADRKEKQAMVDSFYMLSDEDKKDVVENIDKYSIDDIEAKLSIICVRNKVSFNLDDNDKNNTEPTTYSLNDGGEGDYTPAWIKSLQSVAKDIK
jgi:hypothetical protein